MKHDFAERLDLSIQKLDNPTVLGLDPLLSYLPDALMRTALHDAASEEEAVRLALFRFNSSLIEACHELIPAVKFQMACYEQYGAAGLLALKDSVALAREAGMICIADGKRNDIGSSAACYSRAFLGGSEWPDGKLRCSLDVDALTINAWLGSDGIEPFLEDCRREGKGCFILVRTSNPSAGEMQDLRLEDGRKVYEAMADLVAAWGETFPRSGRYSSVGAVVGATWPQEARELRCRMPRQFFLIPGYGAQGGGAEDAMAGFDREGGGGLINASRSLMLAWKAQGLTADHFAKACRQEALAMREALRRARKNAAR